MIAEKDFITIPVEQTITGISLVQENQQLFDQGKQTYDVWVTRGIIFSLDDHQISFEKPIWFSEDIIIRKGYDLLEQFAPIETITDSENWAEDLELKCTRNLVELTEH